MDKQNLLEKGPNFEEREYLDPNLSEIDQKTLN